MQKLSVHCHAFADGDWIPLRHTARGEDLSPGFTLSHISEGAASIAITMDDAAHPIFPNYNHWLIWNIPIQPRIREGIAHGKVVDGLDGAMQGIAYGRHRYKGPKPPLTAVHTYTFTFYILDCMIKLAPTAKTRELLAAMQGHILQQASIHGKFRSRG